MHPLGLIHGRFQVVHNDHLTYLLAGKERCGHLIVGITNPTRELTAEEATNPERSNAANNPLTYQEREAMVRAALIEASVPSEDFQIIPFPISRVDKLKEMAPREAVYFLTIYDDWGHEKRKRFEDLGLTTEVMWDKPKSEKGIEATVVRNAIRDGGDWRFLVPPSVAQLIEKWNLQGRFRELSEGDSGS